MWTGETFIPTKQKKGAHPEHMHTNKEVPRGQNYGDRSHRLSGKSSLHHLENHHDIILYTNPCSMWKNQEELRGICVWLLVCVLTGNTEMWWDSLYDWCCTGWIMALWKAQAEKVKMGICPLHKGTVGMHGVLPRDGWWARWFYGPRLVGRSTLVILWCISVMAHLSRSKQ